MTNRPLTTIAHNRLTQAIGIFRSGGQVSSLCHQVSSLCHLVVAPLRLQQAIAKKNNQEISLKYHAVIDIIRPVVRPPCPRSDRRKFGRIYQRFCFAHRPRFAVPSI
jgi:hypothetical protein